MTVSLDEALEQILFDEKELNTLKQAIQELFDHIINPQQVRTLIFNSYVRIFNDLKSLMPYYYTKKEEYSTIYNRNKDQTLSGSDAVASEFANELQEKNELIELVGGRLQTIYTKLKEKQGNNPPSPTSSNHLILKEVRKTHREADKAFTESGYKEFILLKFIILERWIEFFYALLPPIPNIDPDRISLWKKIQAIEKTFNISFQFKKGFDYWKEIRGGIAHKNEDADREQAEKARIYFEYAERECAYYYVLYG
jgi:hypothetical protein